MLLIRSRPLAGFIIVLLCSMVCSVLTVAVYHVFFTQKIVVMDIAGFIASQKEGYTAGRISAGELVENIDSLVSRISALQKTRALVIDRAMMQAGTKPAKEGPAVTSPGPARDDEDDPERWN
jgi:hypothetical protein